MLQTPEKRQKNLQVFKKLKMTKILKMNNITKYK